MSRGRRAPGCCPLLRGRGGSPVTGSVSNLGLRQAGKAGPLGDLV